MPQSAPPSVTVAQGHEELRSLLAAEAALFQAVESAARSAQRADAAERAKHARRRGEPYAREVCYRSAVGEVLLAWWWEGARCAPHDHGGARGAVIVLSGHFEERSFVFEGSKLRHVGQRDLRRGDCRVVTADAIHEMSARELGVTLHVYSATCRPMRIYDTASATTWLIGADRGAWLPPDDSALEDAQPWTNR